MLFRRLMEPHLKPTPGLVSFLTLAKDAGLGLAVATSAPRVNVSFVLDGLHLRPYFSVIVDETMVNHGKPDPAIYRLAAVELHAEPTDCVVFEDSLAGAQAARRAGMSVIGLTTTHSLDELKPYVDQVIGSFDTNFCFK